MIIPFKQNLFCTTISKVFSRYSNKHIYFRYANMVILLLGYFHYDSKQNCLSKVQAIYYDGHLTTYGYELVNHHYMLTIN